MTSRKDIDQLLERFAETPGCVVDRCASSEGHHFAYRVDANGERTTRKVTVPSTPSSYSQLNTTRRKLRAYLEWRDPAVRRGEPERRRRRAKTPQTTKEPPTMAAQTASGTEKLVRRILDDDYSPQLVRLAIIEAAQQIDPATGWRQGQPRTFQSKPGIQWGGDVFEVIRSMWDDLPQARNNDQVRRLATGLLGSLKDAGEMHLLRSSASDPLWWVAVQEGEWPESDTPGQRPGQGSGDGNGSIGTDHTANDDHAAAAFDASAAPASPASPPSPEPDRESPTMKLLRCDTPGCAYTDTPPALATHKARLAGKPHPGGVYPCRECPVVRTSLTSYKAHMRKHGYQGECCSICLNFFKDRSSAFTHACPGPPQNVHRADGDQVRQGIGAPGRTSKTSTVSRPGAGAGLEKAAPASRPASRPAPDTAVPGTAVSGTVTTPSPNGHGVDELDPVAVARAASEMLARHADVMQENARKDALIIELSEQNADLRRQLTSIKRKLTRLTSSLSED